MISVRDNIVACDEVKSPFVSGIFKPVICCDDILIFNFIDAPNYGVAIKDGYNEHSLTLASLVLNCQLILATDELRSVSHENNSCRSASMLLIRLERHCRVITLSSISAISSQFPGFGV